ncbi:MAG: DUF4388 domain-containing protein [bacterium]
MAEKGEDRRRFRRYQLNSDAVLKIGPQKHPCIALDYSADGFCLKFTNNPPSLSPGNVIEIRIEDPEIDFLGEVMWVKDAKPGVVAGFKRVGNIKGTCQDFRLPDLLIGLQRSGKTGVFEILTGSKRTRIFFKHGDMIFANSNQEDDRFGEVLLKGGKITLEQYLEAIGKLKESKKRLGTILIDLGYLKPTELIWAVRSQVVEIIVNLLTTECGFFEFREGDLPSDETITLNLSAANLIYRGIKRINNFQYILQDFPPLEAVLTFSQNPLDLFQDLSLDTLGKEILSLISSGKTIREILAAAKLNNFEAIKTIYALICARLVVIRREEEVASAVSHEEVISEPLAGVDTEFLKVVETMYEKSQNAGYYEILGLQRWATNEDIKRSFFKMAKEFHPDRHFSLPSEDVKRKLNDIFAQVTEAYNTLYDPEKRKEYDETLGAGPSHPAPHPSQSKEDMAEAAFSDGRSKMLLGIFPEAEKLFAQAIYLHPAPSIYHYYHGLALSKLDIFTEAARAFEEAIKRDPDKANYYAALGHAYIGLGFHKRAKGTFEKALSLSPMNEAALQGLQQVEKDHA